MTEKQKEQARKHRVGITLESVAAGEKVVRQMEGDLFLKGRQLYVRYDEPPEAEMGRTMTTIRAERGELRIVRHGDIRFEQHFIPGKRHVGYLQTPQGRMELETETVSLEVRFDDGENPLYGFNGPAGPLTIVWSYKLTVMGEEAGEYRLVLHAVPFTDPV